jgi:hypothetical protein
MQKYVKKIEANKMLKITFECVIEIWTLFSLTQSAMMLFFIKDHIIHFLKRIIKTLDKNKNKIMKFYKSLWPLDIKILEKNNLSL